MWPFKKTLSERYSKLVKLIKSIDSHFQLTEDKEDSLRLHLPNYKGNQPMDFHIYLMEPFLFISFITEIEGEKISCLNNFPQDTDQQDMFNLAMSNNLNKIHQVLDNKYSEDEVEKKDDEKEETNGNHNSVTSNNDSSDETWGLRDYYDFNESFKKHALTIMILRRGIEFRFFATKNDYNPTWSYIINGEKIQYDNCPSGAKPLVWIMKHYDNREDFCWLLEVLDEQIAHLWVESMEEPEKLIEEIQKYVPQFKLKNNPQHVKVNLGWSWIDIQAILHFIDYCSNQQNKFPTLEKVKPLQKCTTIEELSTLYWSDYTKEQHSQKENAKEEILKKEENISDSIIVESWSLLDFAKTHGKMKRVPSSSHINSETGEEERSSAYCVFVHPTNKNEQGKPIITAIVTFSSELGELSVDEIVQQKSELMVVKHASGDYALRHKKATIDKSGWYFDADNIPTEVTEEDMAQAWTDEYGVMYSKDGKRLLRAPYGLEEYNIKEGTKVICNNSFENLHKLKTVDISSSITIIGELAFYNCSSLCSITIPSSVHVIKKGAFCECRALNKIEFNEGVTIIESHAFSGYKRMTSLRIPESVIEIGDEAFWNCCYIEKVFLLRNVGKLGIGVFSNCSRLKSIIVDKNNEVYDSRDNCNAIIETKSDTLVMGCSSTTIPHSVLCIGILAFGGCTMQNLSIPNNVITISDRAFADCFYLMSIKLSSNLRSIGNRAFQHCENLLSIFIPENVENLGTAAFENCYRLGLNINFGFISVHPDNKFYNSMNNCNAIVERSSNTLIVGCSETIIPDGVTTIGDYAFSGCTGLTTLLIPKSVNSIGKMAFANCTNLVSIVFSNSISNIDKDSFYRCEKLENILVPVGESLKYTSFVPNYAEKIKELNLEDILNTSVSKEEIEEAWTDENGAKYSRNRLRLLEAPRGVERFFVRFGTLAICDNSFDSVGKDTLIDFILPNTVLTIGKFAFANNKGISSLSLPLNTTFIGESAFAGCSSLERVYMPLTIPIIGKNLFEGCGNLKFIFIPYGSMHKYAQLLKGYEKSLIDVCDTHSSSTDSLCGIRDERGVVYSYDGKRLLYDGGRNTQYEIKNGTLAICDGSFESRFDYACLERIIIPNTVIAIGANAFYNCCFESIEIPNSVIYIGSGAFENCYCLKEIRLPKSLKAIDGEAFADCSSLTDVYIPTKVHIADNITGIGVFSGCKYLNNIYIPKGTRTYYEKLFPEHKEKLVELSEELSTKLSDEDINKDVWTDEYGAEYSLDKKRLLYAPDNIKEYSIVEGTEEIGDYAFVNIECEDVDYNYIMANNLDIHDFERYTSELVSVYIPNSVVKIGKGIFDYCTKLNIINIPEGAIERFKHLLPDYEDILVEGDISTVAHLEDLEEVWIDDNGVKYSKDKRKLLKGPNVLTKYAIIPQTKIICDGAFFDCANLKEIHLPESITIIGKYAFYGCDSLTEINLPKAVLEIGEKAFDGCQNLTSLYIPKMEQGRFYKMLPSHFEKFKEPLLNSVIDEKGVVYDNDYQILHFNTLPLDTYSVKSGVKTIDDFAFKPEEWKKDDGTSLQRLSLPSSIVLIGAGAFAFNQCLEVINIPEMATLSYDYNPCCRVFQFAHNQMGVRKSHKGRNTRVQ